MEIGSGNFVKYSSENEESCTVLTKDGLASETIQNGCPGIIITDNGKSYLVELEIGENRYEEALRLSKKANVIAIVSAVLALLSILSQLLQALL